VPPLQGTLALAEGDHLSGRVAEDLDLDVSRLLDVELRVDGGVGEVRLRLALRPGERLRHLLGLRTTRIPFRPRRPPP